MEKANGINLALGAALLFGLGLTLWFYLGSPDAVMERQGDTQPVAVIAQTTTKEPFVDSIQALGTARANQSVEITAQVSSKVEEILFEEGSTVEAGKVLLRLEADAVRANLTAAQATLVESQSLYQRNMELGASGAVSASQLQQLEAQMRADKARVAAAQAALSDRVIRAPFSGRVGLRQISVGGLIQPGTVITTLDDTDPIKLDFSVPELFIGTLEPGQTIEAQTAAYPNAVFDGQVKSVATRVDPVTRSVTVRALLPNPAHLIKPGMFLTVDLIRKTAPALMIPEQAVVPENEKQFVFVIEDGTAKKREVQTGRRRPGEVEIIEGLSAGETIVVEGVQKVRDGAPVALASDAA